MLVENNKKMKVQLKRDTEWIEISSRLVIHIGETEYRVSENKFGELVINKHSLNDEKGDTIKLSPSVGNEIILVE